MTDENTQNGGVATDSALTSGWVPLSDLWLGDRFKSNGSLWTVIDIEGLKVNARKHGGRSIELAEKGLGYLGDPICSWEGHEVTWPVEFIPPNI